MSASARQLCLALLLALASACGDGEPRADAGSPDTGSPDASERDAGAEDASEPDAGRGSSGGRGGLACVARGSVGDREYCEAHVGAVAMRFVLPAGGGVAPYRLAIYLHGDGAGAYRSGSVLRSLSPFADAHDALVVAALAPNGCAWWQRPEHDCDASVPSPDDAHANADALLAALDALRAAYDVRDDEVLFYGSSGGSNFLTGSFFPRFGDRFPGVLAVNCGGEVPWDGALAWDAASARGSRLVFTYGEADFLADAAHEAARFYDGLGFDVEETILRPDVGHCAFDAHGRAAEVWAAALAD